MKIFIVDKAKSFCIKTFFAEKKLIYLVSHLIEGGYGMHKAAEKSAA